jgi:hypothetical protein
VAGAETTTIALVLDGEVVRSWHLDGLRADLAVVDLILRLQLHARRLGGVITVTGLSAELAGLLDYLGLAHLVVPPGCPGCAEREAGGGACGTAPG